MAEITIKDSIVFKPKDYSFDIIDFIKNRDFCKVVDILEYVFLGMHKFSMKDEEVLFMIRMEADEIVKQICDICYPESHINNIYTEVSPSPINLSTFNVTLEVYNIFGEDIVNEEINCKKLMRRNKFKRLI